MPFQAARAAVYDPARFLVPTEREEEWDLKFIRFQPLVRDNKKARARSRVRSSSVFIGALLSMR